VHADVYGKKSYIQVERHNQNSFLVTAIVHKTVAGPQHVSDENIEHIREVFVLQHTTVGRGCNTWDTNAAFDGGEGITTAFVSLFLLFVWNQIDGCTAMENTDILNVS